MLESLTIFTNGGLVLYQYVSQPSLLTGVTDAISHTNTSLNTIIQTILVHQPHRYPDQTYHITNGVTFVWTSGPEFTVVVMYPDILFEGPRVYLKQWATQLLERTNREYDLYYQANISNVATLQNFVRPDFSVFDPTFRILLHQSKTEKPDSSTTATTATSLSVQQPTRPLQQVKENALPKHPSKSNNNSNSNNTNNKSSKEKRQWHDGTAKVTEKAMTELDKSSANDTAEAGYERALQEARQAYLPTSLDLQQQQQKIVEETKQSVSIHSWSTTVTTMLQQLVTARILSDADLDAPLRAMHERLVSKNVATHVSHQLCQSVRQSVRGKRLNTFHRVQTAMAQATETALAKVLLQNEAERVDLLRAIRTKRDYQNSVFSFGAKSSSAQPYVITVMGINGIGKTTSLAKLAYYLQTNDCRPLLVAGDTFRSGAVEQLRVHADCLRIPLYSQGYSKDPSAVAQAAIAQAKQNNHDVVLIDTAGRMQNNVPLMKALAKLVDENQPDCVILVMEALVGHDGLDQFKLFQQAISSSSSSFRSKSSSSSSPPPTIHGLILTKFDTVGDKVGAVLTLTNETRVPVLFCGTGQKYHHLEKLNVARIMDSLLS